MDRGVSDALDYSNPSFDRVFAADLPMMRAECDDAFADIAERLTAEFGGHVIARTVDSPR